MLPKIEQPHFNAVLPISGMNVRYRPYLMKEQKIILIAMSGEESDDIMEAIGQIISNCTEGQVDPKKLSSIDIGFLMMKIRSASEGSIVDVNMHCRNIVEKEDPNTKEKIKAECGHLTPMEVNLKDMEIEGSVQDDLSKVELGGGIGIKLRMPGLDMFNLINADKSDMLKVLPMLIDFVYDADGQIFKLKDEPEEVVQEFLDQLTTKNLTDIMNFFNSLPKIVVKVPFTCEKCGHHEVVVIEDIQSFLD
jgi:hypothetical protein